MQLVPLKPYLEVK